VTAIFSKVTWTNSLEILIAEKTLNAENGVSIPGFKVVILILLTAVTVAAHMFF